jgi:dTDP-4-amino-4,6-dideoxy-D-glucose acyltransferase
VAMHTRAALERMGFAALGDNVQVSELASIHGASRITLGNNTRIDDFCVLSAGAGGIAIGRHVHVAVFCSLVGTGRITLEDFSGLASRVAVYSSNDDYSGAFMTNPTIPAEYTGVEHGDVSIGRHAIVGTGCVVLPGVTLEEGVAIGALSLVNRNCPAFGIYAGRPARRLGDRSRQLLEVEKRFLASRTA